MHTEHQQLQFSRWLHSPLGKILLHIEQEHLQPIWANSLGEELLMIGDPAQTILLRHHRLKHYTIACAAYPARHSKHIFQTDFKSLPIMPSTMQSILIPHSLEFMSQPQHLLQQAEIALCPEGQLIILGFNPFSLWGLRQFFSWHRKTPFAGNYHSKKQLKSWLSTLSFEVIKEENFLFHQLINIKLNHLTWLQSIIKKYASINGGVYLLVARKKVACITSLKPAWKEVQMLAQNGMSQPVIRQQESS